MMEQFTKGPVTAVMAGAGFRGREVYGGYAERHPERIRFVAVAEPDPVRRSAFQKVHGIPGELAFESWDAMLDTKRGRLADAAFICTQDSMHHEPAVRALRQGYHVVLEKPISPDPGECRAIAEAARETGRLVRVCHVLRYTPFWQKVREVVDSGLIGRVIHYDHSENVSFWHFGHSYVRGPYRNKAESSPLILAKTCHDLDLMHWIIGDKPQTVQSTGELTFYRPENAPVGAPERCTDGCPAEGSCPWYAPRLYIRAEPILQTALHAPSGLTRLIARCSLSHPGIIRFLSVFDGRLKKILNWDLFPTSVITTDLSPEGKMKALREGPFGKCIFKCGNDVVDHQVANFSFPAGVTGTLTVHGFSDQEGREIRIFGTKGVLRGYFRHSGERITVAGFRHASENTVYSSGMTLDGHGGGDTGLMDIFVKAVRGDISCGEAGGTDAGEALESHYMAFAAEDARVSGRTLDMALYR